MGRLTDISGGRPTFLKKRMTKFGDSFLAVGEIFGKTRVPPRTESGVSAGVDGHL